MSWQAWAVLGGCATIVAIVIALSNADAHRDSRRPLWWIGWLIVLIAVSAFVASAVVAWPAS